MLLKNIIIQNQHSPCDEIAVIHKSELLCHSVVISMSSDEEVCALFMICLDFLSSDHTMLASSDPLSLQSNSLQALMMNNFRFQQPLTPSCLQASTLLHGQASIMIPEKATG